MSLTTRKLGAILLAANLGMVSHLAMASSHREAPFTAAHPTIDGTDFYAFDSYESGRSDYVTFIANYDPLQDAYGGPNYFALNPNALYEINIDNNGDAKEDLTFQFRFATHYKNLTVPSGSKNIAIPLINIGSIPGTSSPDQNLNRTETYTVSLVRNGRRTGNSVPLTNLASGSETFVKPVDNIGEKSISDYETYAQQYIYTVSIPGCDRSGRVFVGQRREGFVVNLGEVFDLVNTNPVGPRDGTQNTLANKNVTSIALEVPKECLLDANHDPVIGSWTTASLRQAEVLNPSPMSENDAAIHGGAWTQVSRLGNPLVNELVIGLPDKDRFNASEPKNDAQFADYVTNPSLPTLLNVLFGSAAIAPTTPRNDLVAAFLTGFKVTDGSGNVVFDNQLATVTPSEMLRLNTSIAPTAAASQSDLGVLGGDYAGFPNGRRPMDDVVDIALRVVEGAAEGFVGGTDPNGGKAYTDGAEPNPNDYLVQFPYLAAPIPGSPNSSRAAASDDNNMGGD